MGGTPGLDAGLTSIIGVHRHFVDAVTRQLTRSPGAVIVTSPEQEQREAEVRAAVVGLLEAASTAIGSEAFERAAGVLQSDVELLSSVFQNLDLFGVDDEVGRKVALLVGEALSEPDLPADSHPAHASLAGNGRTGDAGAVA